VTRNKVEEIAGRLSEGDSLWFDICAGLIDKKCQRALIEVSSNDRLFPASMTALTIQHLIRPSGLLADFINQHVDKINNVDPDNMIIALMMQPVGDWQRALMQIAEFDEDACRVLYIHQDDLEAEQWTFVENLCAEVELGEIN